jgi:hypothetical protein
VSQTKTTLTESWLLALGRPLSEPATIEHNGGIWSVKLQNSFQTKDGHVIAVWVINQFLRPTPQEEAIHLRRTAVHHRHSGYYDAARYYEELAHKAEREYPPATTSQEFPGLVFE